MESAPQFASLLISRPRQSAVRFISLLTFSLALGAHLATFAALLLSQLLVLEVMRPAGASDQIPPRLVIRPYRSAGKAGRGPGLSATGNPGSPTRAATSTPSRPGRPAPLAPPGTNAPAHAALNGTGDGTGTGDGPYGTGGSGDCTEDCGPGGGTGDGPGPGVRRSALFQEGDPRLVPPRLLEESRVLPRFPDLARRARMEGTVILLIIIQPDGSVGAIEVIRSPDQRLGFDLAAIEAVKLWRYVPARMHGRAVAVQATVMVEFIISR